MQIYTLPMEQLAELVKLQLDRGGFAQLAVTGCSMLPMLRENRDSVKLIPVTESLKKGDIILYQRKNGRYVLHRIISVNGESYICCGDNQFEREPVEHSQVVAVVSAFTRKGKNYELTRIGYRLYRAIWVGLFPLRRLYISVRRKFGNLCRKLRKRKS